MNYVIIGFSIVVVTLVGIILAISIPDSDPIPNSEVPVTPTLTSVEKAVQEAIEEDKRISAMYDKTYGTGSSSDNPMVEYWKRAQDTQNTVSYDCKENLQKYQELVELIDPTESIASKSPERVAVYEKESELIENNCL